MVGHPDWMTGQPNWFGCVWPTPKTTYTEDYRGKKQQPYEMIKYKPEPPRGVFQPSKPPGPDNVAGTSRPPSESLHGIPPHPPKPRPSSAVPTAWTPTPNDVPGTSRAPPGALSGIPGGTTESRPCSAIPRAQNPTPPAEPSLGLQEVDPLTLDEEDAAMRGRDTREEVRSAMEEYASSVIAAQRYQPPGPGYGVTPQDVMVSAHNVGLKTSYDTATSLRNQFVRPALRMLHRSKHPGSRLSNSSPKVGRSKSVPPPKATETWQPDRSRTPQPPKKKDYHWMVWKTNTPTPTPPPKTPQPPSDMPPTPENGTWHPQTCQTPIYIPRVTSPGPEADGRIPDVDVREPTPDVGYRPPNPHVTFRDDLDGPPETPPPAFRNATPAEFDPDHRDNMVSPQPLPMTETDNQLSLNPKFEPVLKAWITGATPQERQIAYNMFKALNGGVSVSPDPGKSYISRARVHARSANPPKQPIAAHHAYQTGGKQIKAPPAKRLYPHQESRIIREMARSLQGPAGMEPSPAYQQEYYAYQPRESYPVARHPKKGPQKKDYTHENSFFMNARQPYRSHFIINPEWVSENPNMKRNLKLMMSTKGPSGLKYGSK